MRIVGRRLLHPSWAGGDYPDRAAALGTWFTLTSRADWTGPDDVAATFHDVRFRDDGRVGFWLFGRGYLVMTRICYPCKAVVVQGVFTAA